MKENEVIEVKTTGRDLTRGVLMQRDSLETCALLPSVDTLAIAAPPCGCRQTPPVRVPSGQLPPVFLGTFLSTPRRCSVIFIPKNA